MPKSALEKHLSFHLAGEEYALPVLQVREILPPQALSPLPGMPPHWPGVIQLRGRIVPVLDLRLRFGMPAGEGEGSLILLSSGEAALKVDAPGEVAALAKEGIQSLPGLGRSPAITGLSKEGERVRILLDSEPLIRDLPPTSS